MLAVKRILENHQQPKKLTLFSRLDFPGEAVNGTELKRMGNV
jgi:hypothetical protein